MPTGNIDVSGSALGRSVTKNYRPVSDNGIQLSKSVPAAAAGTLTTRTSATVGTFTGADAGHGIGPGDRFDMYWVGGSRRNVLAGSVVGAVVPFTVGDGDDLPTNGSAMTVMKQNVETSGWTFDGDDLVALLAGCDAKFTVSITDDSDAELFAYTNTSTTSGAYAWSDGMTFMDNPLAGAAPTKIKFTHGDSDAAHIIDVMALVN